MNRTLLFAGLLAGAVLLLLAYGRYALLLRADRLNWQLAGVAAALLAVGYALSRLPVGRQPPIRSETPPPNVVNEPTPARLAQTGISPRELDVLQLMANGLSNGEIAAQLFIAESTVKTHVSNLLLKLDARRRTEAIRNARAQGLIA